MLRFCRVQQLLFFSFLSWFKAKKTNEGKVSFIIDKADFGEHDINAQKHGFAILPLGIRHITHPVIGIPGRFQGFGLRW